MTKKCNIFVKKIDKKSKNVLFEISQTQNYNVLLNVECLKPFYFPHPHTKYVRKVVSFIEKSMSVRGNDNSKTT